jgi:hypothetical protein
VRTAGVCKLQDFYGSIVGHHFITSDQSFKDFEELADIYPDAAKFWDAIAESPVTIIFLLSFVLLFMQR